MKKGLILLIMVIITISSKPFPAGAQNHQCDPKNLPSESLYKNTQMFNYMKTVTSVDKPENYNITSRLKIDVTYNGTTILSAESSWKIITYCGDILEVNTYGAEANRSSHLFIKGVDITKLVPSLLGKLFRTKISTDEESLIFEVEDTNGSHTYDVYYLKTNEFCVGETTKTTSSS